jgi:hypothetical protein
MINVFNLLQSQHILANDVVSQLERITVELLLEGERICTYPAILLYQIRNQVLWSKSPENQGMASL